MTLPRLIDETVPAHLLGTFGIVSNLILNGGQMTAILMGAGLPDADDLEATKNTQFWRVIFGLPWVMQFISLTSYFFFIKQDTIKYLIDNHKDDQALLLIKKVYHSSEDPHQVLNYIKSTG